MALLLGFLENLKMSLFFPSVMSKYRLFQSPKLDFLEIATRLFLIREKNVISLPSTFSFQLQRKSSFSPEYPETSMLFRSLASNITTCNFPAAGT